MGGSTAIATGGQLGVVTCGCAYLARTPKPSSWPRVNGPAASITTSKVAASLPWRASSTAYSSAWSQQASSSSILAGGSYSACLAGAFPRALKLMPGSATWLLGPPAQMPAVASIVTAVPAPVQAPKLQWGAPPPCPSQRPPPQHLLPLAPPWATTPTPVPHPGLELTGIVHLPGVHWPSTPQGQPLPRTSGRRALHNLGTSSLAHCPDMA